MTPMASMSKPRERSTSPTRCEVGGSIVLVSTTIPPGFRPARLQALGDPVLAEDDRIGTLFVTTTCQNMSEAERAAEPLAGALLACEPGPVGIPGPRFPTSGRPRQPPG